MANSQEFSSVLSKSFTGLQQLLAIVTGLVEANPAPVVMLTSRQYFRSIYMKQGQVAMPGLALLLQSLQVATDRINPYPAKNRGFRIGVNSMQPAPTKAYFLSVVPVNVTFNALYYSNDYEKLLNTCQSWLYHNTSCNLKLVNEQFDLTVGVELDPNLTISEDLTDDSGTYNVLETTVILKTYAAKLFEKYVPNKVSTNVGLVQVEELNPDGQYDLADIVTFDTEITIKDGEDLI